MTFEEEAKRVSDEVRSTCAQAQLAECLVNQRMVGGTSVFGRVVVVVGECDGVLAGCGVNVCVCSGRFV